MLAAFKADVNIDVAVNPDAFYVANINVTLLIVGIVVASHYIQQLELSTLVIEKTMIAR